MGGLIALMLASLIFLSAVLIGMALIMRTRWERLTPPRQRDKQP